MVVRTEDYRVFDETLRSQLSVQDSASAAFHHDEPTMRFPSSPSRSIIPSPSHPQWRTL